MQAASLLLIATLGSSYFAHNHIHKNLQSKANVVALLEQSKKADFVSTKKTAIRARL